MCNFSDVILERGVELGHKQGLEQGLEGMVETIQEMGGSRELAVSQLIKRFNITSNEAQEKVDKYWKRTQN